MASLGIAEAGHVACSQLTNSLTVQFTAAHSNLGTVGVSMEGPGGPYAFDLSPATAQEPGRGVARDGDTERLDVREPAGRARTCSSSRSRRS